MPLTTAHRTHLDAAWNAGRDVFDELFADDHVYHDPVRGADASGPDGLRRAILTVLEGMPDATLAIHEWIDDGESLIARWTLSGTHTGPLWGFAPTGRIGTVTGMHVFRFDGDRIATTRAMYDALGLLDQLGLVTLGVSLGGPALPLG